MNALILTLCPNCAREFSWGFKVDKIPHRTTTEKRKKCENCKKKFPDDILAQYMVKPVR